MECHPDRGGSHEQMLSINEAFQVLADPASKRSYDEWRSNQQNEGARQAAEAAADRAQQKAGDYPRDWGAFEKWFDVISKDFIRAEFGCGNLGGVKMPTAKNSFTAWLFIIGGGLLGLFVLFKIFEDEFKAPGAGRQYRFVALIAIAGGAWIGKIVHQILAELLRSPTATSNSLESDPVPIAPRVNIIPCEKCGQKLRVQTGGNPVRLRCGSCRHEFVYRAEYMPR